MSADAGALRRQADLYSAIKRRSSDVNEQLLLLIQQAHTVGASERDVKAVREGLLADHMRECRR